MFLSFLTLGKKRTSALDRDHNCLIVSIIHILYMAIFSTIKVRFLSEIFLFLLKIQLHRVSFGNYCSGQKFFQALEFPRQSHFRDLTFKVG